MPLTFSQLRSETLGWLDESAATSSDQSYNNVTAALKQAHTSRITEDNWRFMLHPAAQTLTMVASQQVYSLHQEFMRPYWFRNTTQHAWLVETPARNTDPLGISPEEDTDSLRFYIGGQSPLLAQPTSASVVTISSSSAADTEATKAITITGDTTDGVATESITPTGTTPVAGTVSFTHIYGVTKGAAWTGTMTMTSNAAAVTNLKLFATEYGRQYTQMQLLYLPSAGETVSYRFYRRPKNFGVSDNDVPDIPAPFERILIYDSLLLLGAYDNRLDGGRMRLWMDLRDDLDIQMRQAFMEGQSLGAEGRFIMDRTSSIITARSPE